MESFLMGRFSYWINDFSLIYIIIDRVIYDRIPD